MHEIDTCPQRTQPWPHVMPVRPALQVLVDDAADIDAFKDYQPSGGSSDAGSAKEEPQEASSPPEGAVMPHTCRL